LRAFCAIITSKKINDRGNNSLVIPAIKASKNMEKKKTRSFTLIIAAIILGATLFKQFDFKTLKFEHTGLAIVYIIVFVASVYLLIKGSKNR